MHAQHARRESRSYRLRSKSGLAYEINKREAPSLLTRSQLILVYSLVTVDSGTAQHSAALRAALRAGQRTARQYSATARSGSIVQMVPAPAVSDQLGAVIVFVCLSSIQT